MEVTKIGFDCGVVQLGWVELVGRGIWSIDAIPLRSAEEVKKYHSLHSSWESWCSNQVHMRMILVPPFSLLTPSTLFRPSSSPLPPPPTLPRCPFAL